MRGDREGQPDTLYGMFGDAQWTNKERLPDALLKDLIEHFSSAAARQRTTSRPTCSATPTST